jgi:hypothetical protein
LTLLLQLSDMSVPLHQVSKIIFGKNDYKMHIIVIVYEIHQLYLKSFLTIIVNVHGFELNIAIEYNKNLVTYHIFKSWILSQVQIYDNTLTIVWTFHFKFLVS